MKYCILRMISSASNNNKDYEMTQINDNQFMAKWGRIEGSKMSKTYSMTNWDKIRNDKLAKGYVDVTSYVATIKCSDSNYQDIEDAAVADLVAILLKYANEYVQKTYMVDKKDVTRQMLLDAQNAIDRLNVYANTGNIPMFNCTLEEIFTIIPRKMKNVSDHLVSLSDTKDTLYSIAINEQQTLSTLRSVANISKDDSNQSENFTILDAFGLKIRPCTDKENAKIKEKLTGESSDLFNRAFRIEQKDLEERYHKYMKENHLRNRDVHFYWHGTKNQNVWSIIKTGLMLNPKAAITGKMFGYGLYFAPRAKKSIGYTSLSGSVWAKGNDNRGYLIVMKVAYKNPLDVYSHQRAYLTFKENDIKATGNDALYAHKGSMLFNDEIIVYNEGAVCPRYLVELKQTA